jgi:hypothetical protein
LHVFRRTAAKHAHWARHRDVPSESHPLRQRTRTPRKGRRSPLEMTDRTEV